MNTFVDCIGCIVNKAEKTCDKYIKDKQIKYKVMQKILKEIINTDYNRTTPYINSKIMRIIKREVNIQDMFIKEKEYFNKKILGMEKDIEDLIKNQEDSLFAALKLASAGNIIDFGALDNVTFDMVKQIIEKTLKSQFNSNLFNKLEQQIIKSNTLLYLGDNAGEIVFDKMFIKKIKEKYPHINIIFATRGYPTLNDVIEEDAYYVGMDKYAKIINNGTDIPGTDILETSEEFTKVFNDADIIIAKGQGNFESLQGCTKNIYYIFLCKCEMIVKKLSSEKLENMFIHESQI
ncbi:damage-control phosphatase ARMT1 family protein [Haloimpatiens sp. FM7330]|uniref:damage-control phosphatase ARMT1 family protein n=1 Tax=Haloimpatiens sp. FM7330 TaxID=3298610 RepID=UPI0036456441